MVAPHNLVHMCPKCGSTKISLNDENKMLGAFGTPPVYTCMDCGRTAQVFLEVPRSQVKNIQREQFGKVEQDEPEEEKKQEVIKPVHVGTGVSYIVVWWFVAGFASVIGGLVMLAMGFSLLAVIPYLLGAAFFFLAYKLRQKQKRKNA